MRVLIVVTHLLGAGHLTRAAALARAFAAAGHETMLVSGGAPAALAGFGRIAFVQLPPVRIAGTDFRTLLDGTGRPIGEAYRSERRDLLLAALRRFCPDILVTELFPFGRRVLADEFMALLEEARGMRPRPLILSSIRDILVAPAQAEKRALAHERIARFYDAVLVHGDPRLIPLEASWPVDDGLGPLLRYTGYVDENPEPVPAQERHGIVVSGGSSAASLPLYPAAVAAAHTLPGRPWRILIGRGVPEGEFLALRASAPAHAVVERARPDFRALLAGAELSVSQAGYNTAVDLLRTGARSVLVPFEAGHETEQRLRAERLKALGLAAIVAEADLSAESLAEAVERELARSPAPPPSIGLDGARHSVALAEGLVRAAPALHRRIDWSCLDQALDRAADRGCAIRFWWRDDDAATQTPQLDRLLDLARRYGAGIGLAAVPQQVRPPLAERLREEAGAFALVHGWSHANHAPPGEKKAEFGGHRPLATMAEEAGSALRALEAALGPKVLPVFVPPWNRIAPTLAARLPGLGYTGLSAFKDRDRHSSVTDLVQINTHIDPIDWHGTRSLAAIEGILAQIAAAIDRRVDGIADPDEPIGLLTHHLIHEETVWLFCERLLSYLASRNMRLLPMNGLFCNKVRIAVEL